MNTKRFLKWVSVLSVLIGCFAAYLPSTVSASVGHGISCIRLESFVKSVSVRGAHPAGIETLAIAFYLDSQWEAGHGASVMRYSVIVFSPNSNSFNGLGNGAYVDFACLEIPAGFNITNVLFTDGDFGQGTVQETSDFSYVPNDHTPPGLPVGFHASVTSTNITLAWNPSTTFDSAKWRLYRDGLLYREFDESTVSFIDSGAVVGVMYSYQLSNVDISGNESQLTDPVTARILPPIVKPVLEASDITYESVRLSWAGEGIAGPYVILMDGDPIVSDEMTESRLVTGLEDERQYTFAIRYVDAYDRTITSDSLDVTTAPLPPPVYPVLSFSNVKYNGFTVSWQTMRDPPYTLFKDGQIVSSSLTSPIYTFGGTLDDDTAYSLKVGYTDYVGRYLESEESVVTTKAIPPVVVPELTFQSVTYKSLRLVWSGAGESYAIYKDGSQIGTTHSRLYDVSGLESETAYDFYVESLDEFNRTSQSNTVHALTSVEPEPTVTPPPWGTPPAVSHSDNPDLNHVNDALVQGANETKKKGMSVISVILLIFVLVFGAWWLMGVFKKKMNKSVGSSGRGSSGTSSKRVRASPGTPRTQESRSRSPSGSGRAAMNLSQSHVGSYHKKSNGSNGAGRNNYHVEKSYERRDSRKKNR